MSDNKVAEGSFSARAVSPVRFIRSSGGNDGAEVQIQLLDGPSAGTMIVWQGWLGDKTLARTHESLALLGWTAQLSDDAIPPSLVKVVTENEANEFEGKMYSRPRIKWINDPARGPKFVELDAAGVQSAKARLRAVALASPAKAASPDDEPNF